ncbi:unnamed protein product [Bemisia tabaci]|uniref:Uncharacterized protein n=1 Tax=Bemisia tabaci TaxID=7038 RepID=A0A9P0F664_BEMTA|nr:unnamed protein product [Bemisia tabaci]
MAFITLLLASAVLALAGANPYPKLSCPRPSLPEIVPQILQSVAPEVVVIGPKPPKVIEHHAAPYEINYFGKPWIIKHKQSVNLQVFTQTPVVVDEYAPVELNEAETPPAVVVEEVCPEVPAPAPVPAPVYSSPTPCQ